MLKKFFVGQTIFILSFLMAYPSFATHIIGGELTYRCTGDNVYEITLSVYTECGSQAVLEQSYPIQYYASALGISPDSPMTFVVSKISTNEIQLLCTSAVTDCNGGAARGVEVVRYQGTVNLSSFDATNDWRFFWQRAARSEEISTLVLAEEEDFFVEASLNNLDVSCNSSATFQNLALATVCINQEYVFNNAATDPNGDVLKYSLVAPKSSHDTEVAFDGNFSATNFLSLSTAALIDENTGDLSFTPDLLAIGITDFKVEEYRNGVLVGWVRRGIQFTTIDCANSQPKLSSFQETSTTSVSICAGDEISLTLNATDDDGDSLVVSLLSGRGDLFDIQINNVPNPIATILFDTSVSDFGEYQFVVSVTDNVCPNPGVETKTYTIIVRENVVFSLGDDFDMECTETITLEPTVTGGDGNYTYLWSDGSTGTSIEATLGDYALTITDGSGCSSTDNLFIAGDFVPSFNTSSLCLEQAITFTDTTPDTSDTKDIVSWLWDFGDGNTSTDQNTDHTYANPGDYEVELEVTDNGNPACSYTTTQTIAICGVPDFDFDISGSTFTGEYCNYDPVGILVIPATIDNCDLLRNVTFDYGDGSDPEPCTYCMDPTPDANPKCETCTVCTTCLNSSHLYQNAGDYTITVTGINENGCEQTISKDIKIYASPEVNIINDDFVLDCSDPDTLIESEIILGGLGDLSHLWSTGASTTSITISLAGGYAVTVTDQRGCDFTDVLTVTYPLVADFSYTPVCEEVGDIVNFEDKSTSLTNVVDSWLWDFDDPGSGIDNTSTLPNPTHTYNIEGNYNAMLQVTDSDGCTHSALDIIYNTVIDPTYTSLRYTKNEVCFDELFNGIGPEGGNDPIYFWDFGDGNTDNTKNVIHSYLSPGEYNVSLLVTYNKGVRADPEECSKFFEDIISVFALPEVEIVSNPERYCLNEEIIFSFNGDNIEDVEWRFTNLSTGDEDTDTQFSTKYTFTERTNYEIKLTAIDNNGCTTVDLFTQFVDDIVEPDFVSEPNICAKEYITFTESFQDIYENITDYRWDFGDGQSEEGLMPIPLTTHKYEAGGDYSVTLTVFNSFSNCENFITKEIYILRPPQIAFNYDIICAKNTMTFENRTTNGDGNIENYRWIFPDESESTSENTTFYFNESGRIPVSLIATSDLGCTDTLTHDVYVKGLPIAGIELSSPFVEAFVPTQFYDNSQGGDGEIISYYWDFGDEETSIEKDPIHTYQEIKRYPLTHAVMNSLLCSDTISIALDLNSYVELPNAFTPNSDGTNDYLRLIQQGIQTLHEFKVYNRQGKLVFDAGGNPEAQWDGVFNRQPQPAGIYVTQVKALDAYGNEFNFKKNVTLLR